MNVQDKVYRRQAGVRRLLLIGLSVLLLSVTQVAQAGYHYPGCGSASNLIGAVKNYANVNGEPDYIGLEYEGCIYDVNATLTIKADGGNPVTIEGNGAIISGVNAVRVFYVEPGATLILQNVTVRDGRAYGSGGAIANDGGTVTLTRTVVQGSRADDYGGGIYNSGTINLNESLVQNNVADIDGGGIFNQGTLNLNASNVYSNTADRNGAGIHNAGGTLTITNSSNVQGNTAKGSGGGISNLPGASLTITNAFVTLNHSIYDGGGIWNLGDGTLMGSRVTSNRAQGKPGSEGGKGGGVYNQGTLTVETTTLRDNSAGWDGGAMYDKGTSTISRSTMYHNSSYTSSIFNDVNATTTLTNSTVADGGIFDTGIIAYGTLRLANVTVAHNAGTGLIVIETGNAELSNTILTHNSGGDCYNTNILTTKGMNLVGDGSCITGALSGDPLLGQLTDSPGYYPLLSGSKAIDAGDNNECTGLDQRGAARPMDGNGDGMAVCDLGAYEANTIATATPPSTATPGATSTSGATTTPAATETPGGMTATPGGATATPTLPVTPTTTSEPTGIELLLNGDFELTDATQKPVLTPWTVKNGSGDKLKCNQPAKLIANTGNCAFRFKGNVGENAKLMQSVTVENFTFATGETLDLSMFINASSPAVSGKLKLSVKYTDTTLAPDKVTVALRPTSGYENFGGQVTLKNGNLAKIKLQVSHRSTSGKVYVDTVSLRQVGVESLLPLP